MVRLPYMPFSVNIVYGWCLLKQSMGSNSCSQGTAVKALSRIGDRTTSDVVARLRTPDGRDEWIYCHSHILIEKSKYFEDRLSESWPTCQILDSRNCVEVYCQEHDFDYHIIVLRLFYVSFGCSVTDMCHGVKNALGILQVAVELGCPEIVSTCVDYLEASPWEEAEEEEILKIIPGMGLLAEPILARLQPVSSTAIVKIFLSATLFATSSMPPTMVDLKTSAQEQIEYMLTEDDDAPLLTADEEIKSKVRLYFKGLLTRFNSVVNSTCETGEIHPFQCFLVDMSWACQIMSKLEILRDFVENWIDASENIMKCVEQISEQAEMLETKLKVIEVTSKVLEAIGYGTIILPTAKRLHMVKIWLPFVRLLKPSVDSLTTDDNDCSVIKMDGEIWQSLESAFVSIILALPSGEQAEILNEWLENKYIRYPDLTEVFEVWCYRSKVANRRLANIRASNVGDLTSGMHFAKKSSMIQVVTGGDGHLQNIECISSMVPNNNEPDRESNLKETFSEPLIGRNINDEDHLIHGTCWKNCRVSLLKFGLSLLHCLVSSMPLLPISTYQRW